jgi:hypothetical protein
MGTTYGGGGRFVGNRRLILRGAREAHPDHPSHGLEIVSGNAELHRSSDEVEGAEWSGRDRRNRIVFAREGRLFARSGLDDILLADFNGQAPHTEAAPDWAKQPVDARKRR